VERQRQASEAGGGEGIDPILTWRGRRALGESSAGRASSSPIGAQRRVV
jgi:hypothetical protein